MSSRSPGKGANDGSLAGTVLFHAAWMVLLFLGICFGAMSSAVHLQQERMLWLVFGLPLLVLLNIWALARRQQTLRLFVDAELLRQLGISASAARRRWKAVAIMAAFALVVFALARPGWNPKPKTIERQGRDLVFILDVSRSMLAEDLAPSRLERAKLAILDCLDVLQGDRVALVAFAGTATVKCPLTLDYGFFRLMLEDIGPDSIARGGTMIGDALRKALDEVFDDREKQFKDVVLITDGEDHDSFPVEAAKQAGDRGIRIIAIGLGDEREGKRIPITDDQGHRTFLKYNGREVWSKLDADTLLKMVNASNGGKYFNVTPDRTIDLGDVYLNLIASAEKRALESKTIERYEEKFQIFLTLAVCLLGIETVTGDRKRRKP